jgi:hypothetical protein
MTTSEKFISVANRRKSKVQKKTHFFRNVLYAHFKFKTHYGINNSAWLSFAELLLSRTGANSIGEESGLQRPQIVGGGRAVAKDTGSFPPVPPQ